MEIYQGAEKSLGRTPTIKISSVCDKYNKTANFAGIIVYHHNNKFKWFNRRGIVTGFNSQTFYVFIKDTGLWPDEAIADANKGKVHDYLYKKLLGYDYKEGRTCCGGFAVRGGEVEYSSVWLNQQNHSLRQPLQEMPWKSDGSKYLSSWEKIMVDTALEEWMQRGVAGVVGVPDDAHDQLTYRNNAVCADD